MADTQRVWLHWKEHYNQIMGFLFPFLENSIFVDVNLSCQGRSIRAHRLVLSACSPYFRKILVSQAPSENIVITFKELKFEVLHAMVQFMYCGRVQLEINDVTPFLKAAESFGINCFENSNASSTFSSFGNSGVFNNLCISNGDPSNAYPFMQRNTDFTTNTMMLQHFGNPRPPNVNHSPGIYQDAAPFQKPPSLNSPFQAVDPSRSNVLKPSNSSMLLQHLLQSQTGNNTLSQQPSFSSLRALGPSTSNQFASNSPLTGLGQPNANMALTSNDMSSPANVAFHIGSNAVSAANMQGNMNPGPSSSKGKAPASAQGKSLAKKPKGKPGPKPKAKVGVAPSPMVEIDSPGASPDFSLGDLLNNLDIIIDRGDGKPNQNSAELQRSEGSNGGRHSWSSSSQVSVDAAQVSINQGGTQKSVKVEKRKMVVKTPLFVKQPRVEIALLKPQDFVDNVQLTLEKIDQATPRTTRSQIKSSRSEDYGDNPTQPDPIPKDMEGKLKVSANGNLACRTCNKEYVKTEDAYGHIIANDCKPKNFACHICQQRFTYRVGLKSHMKYKHQIMLEDDDMVPSNVDSSYHNGSGSNGGKASEKEGNYPCDPDIRGGAAKKITLTCFRCGLHCFNVDTLKEHLMSAHNLDKDLIESLVGEGQVATKVRSPKKFTEYKCPKCQEIFYNKEKQKKHVKSGACERIACPECNKVLCNRRTLRKHLLNVHNCSISYVNSLMPKAPEAEPNIPCDNCGKMFRFKKEVMQHKLNDCPAREGVTKQEEDPIDENVTIKESDSIPEADSVQEGDSIEEGGSVHEEVPFVEVEEKAEPPKYTCESCHAGFDTEEILAQHVEADECQNRLVVPTFDVEDNNTVDLDDSSTVDIEEDEELMLNCTKCQQKFHDHVGWLQHREACGTVKDLLPAEDPVAAEDTLPVEDPVSREVPLPVEEPNEVQCVSKVVSEIVALNSEDGHKH